MTSALATTELPTTDLPDEAMPALAERFRLRPAPRREPPFDDELVDLARRDYDRPLPFPVPDLDHVGQLASVSPLRAALPDPAHWGRRLLVGVTEVAAGRRPLNQLTALLSPSVAQGLRVDFERAATAGRPHWTHRAVVRSVRSSQPSDRVAEVSATVRAGTRVRAIAMRIEVRHGRWCCTRLILG